jgi:hypothetical protein
MSNGHANRNDLESPTAVSLASSAEGGVALPTMVNLGQDVLCSRLRGDTKQGAKEPSLSMAVVPRDPEYLPFANHLRRSNA